MTYMVPFKRVNRRTVPVKYNSVDTMIDDFFGDMLSPTWDFAGETFKMDVQNKEDTYLVEADMPGVSKDEISLELEENTLKIQVNREETKDEEKNSYVHKERRVSSMSRSVYLQDADGENVDAKLENGVLTISVPKTAKADRVRQIEIN